MTIAVHIVFIGIGSGTGTKQNGTRKPISKNGSGKSTYKFIK